MTEATVRVLCEAEYDFVALATRLDELAERLAACHDCPRARLAARQLPQVRLTLERVLFDLDADVSDAIAAAERLAPAPF